MCRERLIYVFLLICTLGWIPVEAAPKPVGWWKLDDGGGTTAIDSVGTVDGTLRGGPAWVEGINGGALQFDGSSSAVDLGTTFSAPPANFTISLWVNIQAWTTEWSHVLVGTAVDDPWDQGWNLRHFGSYNAALWPGKPADALCFTTRGVGVASNGQNDMPSDEAPPLDEWVHIACVCDTENHMKYIYFNGESQGAVAVTGDGIVATTRAVYIGARSNDSGTGTTGYFTGMIDDVRFYDVALSEVEVRRIALGQEEPVATKPSPADAETDVFSGAALNWTAGPLAGAHDVYLGTSFEDVNSATADSPLLVSQGQSGTTYQPATPLEFDQTYYWRVDEVNATPDNAVWKGNVWSFTVEPLYYVVDEVAPSSSATTTTGSGGLETVVDGEGLTDGLHGIGNATMWSGRFPVGDPVWLQFDFDRVYKLYGMHVWNYNGQYEPMLGLGLKEVSIEYAVEPNEWLALGDFVFAQGTSVPTYSGQRIDLDGVVVRSIRLNVNSRYGTLMPGLTEDQIGLSEIQFLYKPVAAREPQPTDGQTDVDIDSALSWWAGREAVLHEVYLGTDADAVAAGTTPFDSVATSTYDPPTLDLGATYYWKIVEVNEAATPASWAGDVWSFSTPDFILVDGFEQYTDEANEEIFTAWADGYEDNSNGSQVGYDNPPYAEGTVVHSGEQSMPFQYGKNGATISEATLTLPNADWTTGGAAKLVLYFYGDPANSADQLYMKINGQEIPYDGPAASLQRRRWNPWVVDLASVTGGVGAVGTLTLGVRGAGSGTLFVDDIRLYREAPEIPTPIDPGTANLVAYYAMNNNVQDSSGNGNNGTLVGAPTFTAGLSATDRALTFNGTTDAVDLGNKAVFNPTGSLSISLWANIGDWTTSWGNVMISNRGEGGVGWQLRRYSSDLFCFTTRGTDTEDLASTVTPPLEEWVHITCVYDDEASTKAIYINGIQDRIATTTPGAHITATTHNTYIGARADGGNTGIEAYFTGSLDEIRIYDRALTADEADFLSMP